MSKRTNSRRRYRRKSRLSRRGGMPVYRNANRVGETAINTFNAAAAAGTMLVLKFDSTAYSFFFEVRLPAGSNAYLNLTPTGPVPVRTLGMKVVLISTGEFHYTHIDETGRPRAKITTTVTDFRAECTTQRLIFDRMPGHSLVPGILHSRIEVDNADSRAFAMRIRAIPGNDHKTTVGINSIIQTLVANPNFRLGYVVMELIAQPVSVSDYCDHFTRIGNIVAPLFVTNMARWALLKIAHVTGILHADFHLGNIITGTSPENMLFADALVGNAPVAVPIPQTVQVIDWGRRVNINGTQLKANIDALFLAFEAYIIASRLAFRVPALGQPPPRLDNVPLDQQIHAVLRQYLEAAQPYNVNNHWQIEGLKTDPANPNRANGIDSFIICFFEARYRRSRTAINQNQALFASVVQHDPTTVSQMGF